MDYGLWIMDYERNFKVLRSHDYSNERTNPTQHPHRGRIQVACRSLVLR